MFPRSQPAAQTDGGQRSVRQYRIDGGGKRYISGLVTAARVAGHQGRSVVYELRLEPWLKILTHTSDYKAFQNKNVVEILDEVLDEYPGQWKNDWWKIIRLAPGRCSTVKQISILFSA